MNADLELRLSHKQDEAQEEFLMLLVRLLSCHLPIEAKVKLTFEKIENGEDDTAYILGTEDGLDFEIVIDPRLNFGTICDYIVHEMGHAIAWEADMATEDVDDHGPTWGIAYAAAYRMYLALYGAYWEGR